MIFAIEYKKQNKINFLDVKIIHKEGNLTTSVYGTPTFSEIHTHLDRFLPYAYKFQKINFLKHGCYENFINKCFKKFIGNIS